MVSSEVSLSVYPPSVIPAKAGIYIILTINRGRGYKEKKDGLLELENQDIFHEYINMIPNGPPVVFSKTLLTLKTLLHDEAD